MNMVEFALEAPALGLRSEFVYTSGLLDILANCLGFALSSKSCVYIANDCLKAEYLLGGNSTKSRVYYTSAIDHQLSTSNLVDRSGIRPCIHHETASIAEKQTLIEGPTYFRGTNKQHSMRVSNSNSRIALIPHNHQSYAQPEFCSQKSSHAFLSAKFGRNSGM
jgi:hypothetical protein